MGLLSLTNGEVDVQVSLDYGPRVLRYGYVHARNVFADTPATIDTPSGPWRARGGHRLWVAPESLAGSYAPDNEPVDHVTDGALFGRINQRTDAAGIEKQLTIEIDATGTGVEVNHRVMNRTPWPIAVAPWAISIVTADGTAIIPQPTFRRHDEDLLPARPLVQWSFTDLTDPRWNIGRRLLSLTPDAARAEPQKIGVGNRQGWCALVCRDVIFMKRFAWNSLARYPDCGCNNEVYTAADYLEIESLGPISTLAPGQFAEHVEHWHLFPNVETTWSSEGLSDHLLGLARLTDAGALRSV